MVIEALHRPQRCIRLRVAVTLIAGSALLLALLARFTSAQSPAPAAAKAVMAAGPTAAANMARHMEMSPTRARAPGDSARAATVARELRAALLKYRDTTAAVADGYRMFMPQVKEQRVYHFTNNWRAVQEGFRFDPASARCTSPPPARAFPRRRACTGWRSAWRDRSGSPPAPRASCW